MESYMAVIAEKELEQENGNHTLNNEPDDDLNECQKDTAEPEAAATPSAMPSAAAVPSTTASAASATAPTPARLFDRVAATDCRPGIRHGTWSPATLGLSSDK
ncbi:protein FAR1-RELATED SEQUENCE 5-like [Panicum miliaceum]|uniref:Protein FAR1-RELATED SEQUENCE 5-like n=1 Tax=Panicum miliaceum TaxID=4540 RepID=A0A3L6QA44_PANMI|nr:protein FAR1-RELATED SEQUENCE 5-like [Panicum miliaceum]